MNLITTIETKLTYLVKKTELTSDDINAIGYLLSSILTEFFVSEASDASTQGWSVDDMYPSDVKNSNGKLTFIGNIYWLHGGEKCEYYQADIATDTMPILYSIKLKDKHQKQQHYIGKTYTGWVVNTY